MFNQSILKLERCESTQDELWSRWSSSGAMAPEALYTLDQRSGRGRLGRSWVAPKGSCLCLSWRVPSELPAEELWGLSFVGGLALARLTRSLGAPCSLKWPNDLLWRGQKLAGVLCEAKVMATGSHEIGSSSSPRVVIGVGINVTPNVAAHSRAVSLQERLLEEGLSPPSTDTLAAQVLERLKESYTLLRQEGSAAVIEAWRHDSLPVGTWLKASGRIGKLKEVTERGSLLLDTSEGVVSIESGEAELIGLKGTRGS